MLPPSLQRACILTIFAATGILAACGPATPDAVPPARSAAPATPTASVTAAAATADAPPVAPVREVRDVYFGTTIVDPYRWMEDASPELMEWAKGQTAFTRRTLDAQPLHAEILARVRALDADARTVDDARRRGKWLVYLKTDAGEAGRSVYVREGLAGAERKLVDVAKLDHEGQHAVIDYIGPSPDGALVAYGVSYGGSEKSTLHVIETATGKPLPDAIERADTSEPPSWRADGKSFFYTRLQKVAPGAPQSEFYRSAKVHLHVLGADPEKDVPVLGHGLSPDATLSEDDFPSVLALPGGKFVMGRAWGGSLDEVTLWIAPADKVSAKTPWKKIADLEKDQIQQIGVHGDDLYLYTHKDAPRFKVVRTSLSKPDVAKAVPVVPEGNAVLSGIAVAKDALYLSVLDGATSRLRRVPFVTGPKKEGPIEDVPLPFSGSIRTLAADPDQPGAMIHLRGWLDAARWYSYDPAAKKLSDTALLPASPADFAAYAASVAEATSKDGTKVPLTIVARRDLPKDGARPVWLEGYGAYGFAYPPNFNPMRLAWLERGAVYAVCHVRGGGERGDQWHRDGMMAKKQNGIDDFLACADRLVSMGYTTAAHIAVSGKSAGGLIVGGAVTQAPEKIGAAFFDVGDANALRFEQEPGGPLGVQEFGTLKTEDGFRALLVQDSYHRVQSGTRYPAILLTAGWNDPRVPVWQPSKMAARLQSATSSAKPVLLRVDFDAGHGGFGATKTQQEEQLADVMTFLLWQLGGK